MGPSVSPKSCFLHSFLTDQLFYLSHFSLWFSSPPSTTALVQTRRHHAIPANSPASTEPITQPTRRLLPFPIQARNKQQAPTPPRFVTLVSSSAISWRRTTRACQCFGTRNDNGAIPHGASSPHDRASPRLDAWLRYVATDPARHHLLLLGASLLPVIGVIAVGLAHTKSNTQIWSALPDPVAAGKGEGGGGCGRDYLSATHDL